MTIWTDTCCHLDGFIPEVPSVPQVQGKEKMSVDWDAVAERLRTVVHAGSDEDMMRTAEHIGVRVDVLRESLKGNSPLSAVKVIAALARQSGVDPTWILTGNFDTTTHRQCVEGSAEEVERLVKDLISAMAHGNHDSHRAER